MKKKIVNEDIMPDVSIQRKKISGTMRCNSLVAGNERTGTKIREIIKAIDSVDTTNTLAWFSHPVAIPSTFSTEDVAEVVGFFTKYGWQSVIRDNEIRILV